jgi:hypothetical protein
MKRFETFETNVETLFQRSDVLPLQHAGRGDVGGGPYGKVAVAACVDVAE